MISFKDRAPLRDWEIEEIEKIVSALAKNYMRNRLIREELTGFAGPLGFLGQAGRVIYADELGITDDMVYSAARHSALAANEARSKVLVDSLVRAYGLDQEQIEKLVKPLVDGPDDEDEERDDFPDAQEES